MILDAVLLVAVPWSKKYMSYVSKIFNEIMNITSRNYLVKCSISKDKEIECVLSGDEEKRIVRPNSILLKEVIHIVNQRFIIASKDRLEISYVIDSIEGNDVMISWLSYSSSYLPKGISLQVMTIVISHEGKNKIENKISYIINKNIKEKSLIDNISLYTIKNMKLDNRELGLYDNEIEEPVLGFIIFMSLTYGILYLSDGILRDAIINPKNLIKYETLVLLMQSIIRTLLRRLNFFLIGTILPKFQLETYERQIANVIYSEAEKLLNDYGRSSGMLSLVPLVHQLSLSIRTLMYTVVGLVLTLIAIITTITSREEVYEGFQSIIQFFIHLLNTP